MPVSDLLRFDKNGDKRYVNDAIEGYSCVRRQFFRRDFEVFFQTACCANLPKSKSRIAILHIMDEFNPPLIKSRIEDILTCKRTKNMTRKTWTRLCVKWQSMSSLYPGGEVYDTFQQNQRNYQNAKHQRNGYCSWTAEKILSEKWSDTRK